jgi:hypothetical protein
MSFDSEKNSREGRHKPVRTGSMQDTGQPVGHPISSDLRLQRPQVSWPIGSSAVAVIPGVSFAKTPLVVG